MVMPKLAEDIINRANALSADERVLVIESLLDTLRPADAHVLADWGIEGEDRLDGYLSGKLEAIDAEEVLARHHKS